ncbi:MAG: hypothetical protein OXK80_01345 [Bdellovibrionales bacterium]|nr:hypothetical protein [Bdellovibrionales bacterium]
MYKRISLIGLFIFFSLYVYPLFAEVPGYFRFTQSVGEKTVETVLDEHQLEFAENLKASDLIPLIGREDRKGYSTALLQQIYEYRLDIQENAYATTMKLCPAYRIAKGMGLPEYHRNLGESRYINHESPEVREWARNMNDEYGTALSSSFQEWVYVMYEGAAQPFSNMAGVKADWINVTNIPMNKMDHWFYSFYIYYLVRSLGFVQAIVHCLGTTDVDEVNQFIYTVLVVDLEMSLAGYVATFWTGDKIFRLLLHGLRWSSRPIGRALVSFLHRKHIPPGTVKKYAAVAGVSVLGALGIWITNAIMDSQEMGEFSQEFIQQELESIKNEQLQEQEN